MLTVHALRFEHQIVEGQIEQVLNRLKRPALNLRRGGKGLKRGFGLETHAHFSGLLSHSAVSAVGLGGVHVEDNEMGSRQAALVFEAQRGLPSLKKVLPKIHTWRGPCVFKNSPPCKRPLR